jgi:hypothetical protein
LSSRIADRAARFSKAVSYGNALDLNECDFLEYLRTATKVVGLTSRRTGRQAVPEGAASGGADPLSC